MSGKPPGPSGLSPQSVVDTGTACLYESPAPGPIGCRPRPRHRDEISDIAEYIAGQMNVNARGEDAKRMAELNGFSAEACITDFSRLPLWQQIVGLGLTPQECVDRQMTYRTSAALVWAAHVREGGPWDHKPYIASRFTPVTNPQHYHRHGDRLYYYDVWSNIHYGYVGAAAGFSGDTLLDGASAEHAAAALLRGDVKTALRGRDDDTDRTAISIGMALYRQHPHAVTARQIVEQVVAHSRSLNTRTFRD